MCITGSRELALLAPASSWLAHTHTRTRTRAHTHTHMHMLVQYVSVAYSTVRGLDAYYLMSFVKKWAQVFLNTNSTIQTMKRILLLYASPCPCRSPSCFSFVPSLSSLSAVDH